MAAARVMFPHRPDLHRLPAGIRPPQALRISSFSPSLAWHCRPSPLYICTS